MYVNFFSTDNNVILYYLYYNVKCSKSRSSALWAYMSLGGAFLTRLEV